MQAQGSDANIVALGSSGTDLISLLKQAREFGVGRDGRQQLASFVLTTTDIAALGLETTQGVLVNESFYWNLDPGTRARRSRTAGSFRDEDCPCWLPARWSDQLYRLALDKH